MKSVFTLLIVLSAPVIAQESADDHSMFDALKVGNWVRYSSAASGSLLDITVIDKPAGTTIKRYREDLAKAREDANAERTRQNEALRDLRTADLKPEERFAKEAALREKMSETMRTALGGRGAPGPFELTAIRNDHIVVNDGKQERFIAKSAVRMIIRNVAAGSVGTKE